MRPPPPSPEDEVRPALGRLLADLGREGEFELTALPGGSANRILRLDGAGGEPLAVKVYLRHPLDERNRAGAEWSFASFLEAQGIAGAPGPIARDDGSDLAIYRFVDGRRLETDEIDADRVATATRFLTAIDGSREAPGAAGLPDAAGAAFSIEGHLLSIERRIASLADLDPATPIERDASHFVTTELSATGQRVANRVREALPALGVHLKEELPPADRILSPSDFGFHNALRTAGGEIVFVDFEDAGWDDPARTVGDFFSQPWRPVPRAFRAAFVEALTARLPDPAWHAHRIEILGPVFEVRWVATLLAGFLPSVWRRNLRTVEVEDAERRKAERLEQARRALAPIAAR